MREYVTTVMTVVGSCPPHQSTYYDWWTEVDKWTRYTDTMPQNAFALRCDYTDDDKQSLSDWLSSNADGYLVCYEEVDGENPHIHALVYSGKNIDTLRKSFKRAFPDKKGNGAYSLKACDGDVDDYCAYICKGGSVDDMPYVVFACGLDFDEGKVVEMHERYWDNNAKYQKAAKERSMSRGSMVDAVEKVCREEGVRAYERKRVALVYIREMKKMRKAISIFAGKAVVNGVVALLDEEETGATDELACALSAV